MKTDRLPRQARDKHNQVGYQVVKKGPPLRKKTAGIFDADNDGMIDYHEFLRQIDAAGAKNAFFVVPCIL